jgi:hypothetical protein
LGWKRQPDFRIQECMSDESERIYVTRQIVREMTERGLFHLDSVMIPMSNEESFISIDLHLTGNTRYPISGFPRLLADGDVLRKTRNSTLVSLVCHT